MVSELNIFFGKLSQIAGQKKVSFFADFALFCLEELVWSPSYYTRAALKMGGGCRASMAPALIRRVDAQTRVSVDVWTRGRVNRPIFFFFINQANSPKLYWSYNPHRSRDSMSPVCGIFFWEVV